VGGITSNPRLDMELAHAKAGTSGLTRMKLKYLENMPKAAIERAIAKGEPRALAQGMFSMTYEAMLPGGIALVM
jgi:transcriptional/translational regulatory protein YebC/TACO1